MITKLIPLRNNFRKNALKITVKCFFSLDKNLIFGICSWLLLSGCSVFHIDKNISQSVGDKNTSIYLFQSEHLTPRSSAIVSSNIFGCLLGLAANAAMDRSIESKLTKDKQYLNKLDREILDKIENMLIVENVPFNYHKSREDMATLKQKPVKNELNYFKIADSELFLKIKVYYEIKRVFTTRNVSMGIYWKIFSKEGKELAHIYTHFEGEDFSPDKPMTKPLSSYEERFKEDFLTLALKCTEDFIAQLNEAIQEEVNENLVALEQ